MSSVIRGGTLTISASSVKSASGNSGVVQFPDGAIDACQFLLNVTASNTPTTLDVYLQHSIDGGTTWYDFAHFAQVGAVSTAKQALTWSRRTTPNITASQAVVATGDAALAAGVVINGPVVDNQFRAKWVIVGTSYTFSLTGIFDKD
jgi:hypothetical protein